jgi:hypothetical protein
VLSPKNTRSKRKQQMIAHIELLRKKNPNICYPNSLADGTTKDIIKYDIKMYQLQNSHKGNYKLINYFSAKIIKIASKH